MSDIPKIHLHKYDNPQWAVVTANGMVIRGTFSFKKTDSIKIFVDMWNKKSTCSKWRNCRKKGYRCIKVHLEVSAL